MGRIVKFDILRVVASFSIVLLHVSASYWGCIDIYGREFIVMSIYNSITRFAVPVFFMLSGLFLVSPHREELKIGKRILKLLLLFYVWSAFYAFQGLVVAVLGGKFTEEIWTASVQRFIFGHSHMWFLYMLIGFYILIPIAKQICTKKEVMQYYVMLWIGFRFLLPCLTNLFHLYTLQARLDALGLDILIGYFGYFILGYYLNVTDMKREVRWGIYGAGIIAVSLTAILTVRDCRNSGTYVERWFSPGAPNVLVMSMPL